MTMHTTPLTLNAGATTLAERLAKIEEQLEAVNRKIDTLVEYETMQARLDDELRATLRDNYHFDL